MSSAVPLLEASDLTLFGGKSSNLAKLLKAKLPVPDGFAVGVDAFDKEGKLTKEAKSKINSFTDQNQKYAVRSSALAEDAESKSWAGQFNTFLNVKFVDVIDKIEACHNSVTKRSKAYADEKSQPKASQIAVVIQEMIDPEYAGVLFTKDPVTGKDEYVVEYVEGLGEQLVSGQVDPEKIQLTNKKPSVPFDADQLVTIAKQTEKLFNSPQDIEWAFANNKVWLTQSRPITSIQSVEDKYALGDPEDLFYWGPSRVVPKYMSDFMVSVEVFFERMAADSSMPNPPKSIVLFWEGQMVWLSNAKDFAEFTKNCFLAYQKQDRFDQDHSQWKTQIDHLEKETDHDDSEALLDAWKSTLFAEFSLYGADAVISQMLDRFDQKTRQKIWGAFTVPDGGTFLSRIDQELLSSKDVRLLAEKYPWIADGYDGVKNVALDYFSDRLSLLKDESASHMMAKPSRQKLINSLGLTETEVNTLTLVRDLAMFMDERKAWMMQTRRLVKKSLSNIEHGWFFFR